MPEEIHTGKLGRLWTVLFLSEIIVKIIYLFQSRMAIMYAISQTSRPKMTFVRSKLSKSTPYFDQDGLKH